MTKTEKYFLNRIFKHKFSERKYFWQWRLTAPILIIFIILTYLDIEFQFEPYELFTIIVLSGVISFGFILDYRGSVHFTFKAIKNSFLEIRKTKDKYDPLEIMLEVLKNRAKNSKRLSIPYIDAIFIDFKYESGYFREEGIDVHEFEDLYIYLISLYVYQMEKKIGGQRWLSFKESQLDQLRFYLSRIDVKQNVNHLKHHFDRSKEIHFNDISFELNKYFVDPSENSVAPLINDDNGLPIDKDVIGFLENGEKVTFGKLKDGRMDGEWTIYHDNGQPASEMVFKNGKPMELIGTWDENGSAV
tara:strand:+ start:1543 stop:2448 length:906 start_codon:yes stop_codon:yes gene_type:complete